MKAQILKIAGVKNEKEFYKKFPTEEAFMKKHGKQLKKAAGGMPVAGLPGMTFDDISGIGKMIKTDKTNNLLSGIATSLGPIVGAVQDYNQTDKDINNLKAYGEISDVVAKAAATRPERLQRKIDYNAMRSQTVNPLGVGTNYLAAEDGAEIANTFAPNTIYTDMGYEPLNDSNVKQFQNGGFAASPFSNFAGIAGGLAGNLGSAMGKGTGRGGSWAQTLGALGNVASMVPGVGTLAGIALNTLPSLAGGLFGDAPQQNELQMAQDKLASNLGAATLTSGAQSFQGQNSSFMEDGGWVSNDWMPQTITKFGEYNMDELLAPPHDADMLRSGGHLAQVAYTPPSARAMYTGRMDDGGVMHSTNMMFDTDRYPRAKYGSQMAFGGDVQVGNGYMKPLSDDVQELVGPSHEDGGMPFSNGNNLIEAEGKETVMKTYGEGGSMDDGSVTIFGNRYINQDAADFVGIKPGRKYKIESKELALNQTKFEKKATKNFASANDMEVSDMFSQIEQRTKLLNGEAFTKKAAMAKQQLQDLAIYQNETGDAAEALGLEINAFDKGIAKQVKKSNMAKFGSKLESFAAGGKVGTDKKKPVSPSSIGDLSKAERKAMAIANGIKNYTGTAAQNKKLASIVNEANANPIMDPGTGVLANAQTAPFNMFAGINPSNPVTPYAIPGQKPFIPKTIPSSFSPEGQLEKISPLEGSVTLSPIAETNVPIPRTLYNKDKSLDEVKVYPEAELPVETSVEKNVVDESNPIKKKKKGNTDWMNAGLTALNSLVPFVRPTNQRPLNPDQLVPEMMALSMNQLEPVQAQLYNPMLQAQPYRVSLQDQRNEVIAQQRAAERMSYGNPAAAAMIAAGSSDALNKINAEEFRLNQSETMRAAESNRAQMNEAQRVNLGILDKQYERQSMASSNTKQQALEVAKSLAQKQAENRKVNNRQAVLENMYPTMSFTKNGVAYKNPMYTAMFNIPDVGTGATSKEDITSPANFFKNEETTKKKPGRNGAIVKAIKGL